jgi:hypothetical protein
MMGAQMELSDILGGALNGPLMPTEHRAKMGELMRRFASAGVSLQTLSGPRHLGRKVSTLRRYARDFGLKFPDYVPLSMREKIAKTKTSSRRK